MDNKKITDYLFRDKKTSEMTTIALISGLAIGTALGALYMKGKSYNWKQGYIGLLDRLQGNTKQKANLKLGHLITDVSNHIQKSAAGLL
ncbi:MAG: hypothetical protein REI78_01215 [Pedobacter sp.]|nr:hypothetical protein [Pedobacter sp.]MDQ8051608.1 hypothetical protein [Pedobacter sp.]